MERLLRQADIAAMLGTSPGVAASILARHGVQAIDFGRGRARGRRWLESAVKQAMLDMHDDAQPKPKASRASKAVPQAPTVRLANMSAGEVFALTQDQCVQ